MLSYGYWHMPLPFLHSLQSIGSLNEKVYYRNSGILLMPLLVGLIQMLLLWNQLRWPWVWPILTILGIPLSFLGIWWFMLCIGGGFGVTQSIHLKLSGYRRVYLWILLSFSGWVAVAHLPGHGLVSKSNRLTSGI